MTIRNRLSLQFSGIVASILLLFSGAVYLVSANHRQEEFYERLKRKARTTARLLLEVKEVDKAMLKIIDRNTISALIDEKVLIFNESNKLVYSSVDDYIIHYQPVLLQRVREEGEVETFSSQNELVGVRFAPEGQTVVVLVSAYDQFGRSKLRNLRLTLLWGLLAGLALTIGLGFFYAGRALRPVARINQQVQTITARNLRQRLDEGPRQDEIDQLAVNFNAVLNRLEAAFERQRSFVSHASHELRTPLAALKSEIQLGRDRPRSPKADQTMLANLELDAERLIALTNSLLFLARTLEEVDQSSFNPVRIDEVVFAAQEELSTRHLQYRIDISYSQLPNAETDMIVRGNENLLKRVVVNLCDNACKYSPDHRAEIRIAAEQDGCVIAISDRGIGIASDERVNIFEPFYRTKRAMTYEGFGIGLAICRQIVALHQGKIEVSSEPGKGSVFEVWIPKHA